MQMLGLILPGQIRNPDEVTIDIRAPTIEHKCSLKEGAARPGSERHRCNGGGPEFKTAQAVRSGRQDRTAHQGFGHRGARAGPPKIGGALRHERKVKGAVIAANHDQFRT